MANKSITFAQPRTAHAFSTVNSLNRIFANASIEFIFAPNFVNNGHQVGVFASARNTTVGSTPFDISVGIDDNSDYFLYDQTNGAYQSQFFLSTFPNILTTGRGYHFVVVKDNGVVTAYLNAIKSSSVGNVYAGTVSPSDPAALGSDWFSTDVMNMFSGSLQDVSYFTRALSEAEIKDHYERAMVSPKSSTDYEDTIIADGAQYYWKCDDAAVTNHLVDYGPNGQDFQVISGADVTWETAGLRADPATFITPPAAVLTRFNNLKIPRENDISSVRFSYPYNSSGTVFPLKNIEFTLAQIQRAARNNNFYPLTALIYFDSKTGDPPMIGKTLQNGLYTTGAIDFLTNNQMAGIELLSSENFSLGLQDITIPPDSSGNIIVEFLNFPYKPQVYNL